MQKRTSTSGSDFLNFNLLTLFLFNILKLLLILDAPGDGGACAKARSEGRDGEGSREAEGQRDEEAPRRRPAARYKHEVDSGLNPSNTICIISLTVGVTAIACIS